MTTLAGAGLAHGDLSPYNVLVHDGRLVLIDLPQVVDVVANPQGPAFLARDVANVAGWFRSRGLDLTDDDVEALTARLLEETGMRVSTARPLCTRGDQAPTLSLLRRQRMPLSRNSSISPSKTALGLPVSYSVRRSLTIWYGCST